MCTQHRGKGVKVYNTPGLNAEAVAELTIGLAFCIVRRMTEFGYRLRSGGKIIQSQSLGESLFKKTSGVVDMGAIGRAVASKWIGAVNGRVIAYDPYAPEEVWERDIQEDILSRTDNLEDLLSSSDVVALHVPENAATRNMLSHKQFFFAYGGKFDPSELCKGVVVLRKKQSCKRLSRATYSAQGWIPWFMTFSKYRDTLLNPPRVVITPHVGASTKENQIQSGMRVVQILLDLWVTSPSVPKALNDWC